MGPIKLHFQGIAGAHSEKAGRDFFGEKKIEVHPCHSFDEIFTQVERSKQDYGIIPIENSLAGSLHTNYDALMRHNVVIVGEVKPRIHHHLLAVKKVPLDSITKVYSHPQALMQCQNFLRENLPNAVATPYFDTAGSAKFIAEQADPQCAALASTEAAQANQLQVLKSAVEDNEKNYTRFLVIAAQDTAVPVESSADSYKTSIVYALKNMPGALHKSLTTFAIRDVDLLKIESRPLAGSPWEYLFYLDFVGSVHDEVSQRALGHLEELTQYIKVLGSYPAAKPSAGKG